MEYVDVIVVGAGLAGIGVASRLQKECPERSYVVLEGRERLGGTWDHFRYPGIRADVDMYQYGYDFKPWRGDKAIADGASILDYIKEAARENGVDPNIRYQHHVKSAEWSSSNKVWTVKILQSDANEMIQMTCNFLVMCSGYFSHKRGYTPNFKGQDDFEGQIIHPQDWHEDLDYANKQVIVIGSGATAVTMLPAIAAKAAHVIMVQRSPSYVVPWPAKDLTANFLRKILPTAIAYRIIRWRNRRVNSLIMRLIRVRPALMTRIFLAPARRKLGPDFDFVTHFTPHYKPWDQRVCFAIDGDFFIALRSGKASIVTDKIDRFTDSGLLLDSGDELSADVIVTATGMNMELFDEIDLCIDGRPFGHSENFIYKASLFSDVPNFCTILSYDRVVYTFKVDLVSKYLCRLLNHMSETGTRQCMPCLRESDYEMESTSIWEKYFVGSDPKPGYFERVKDAQLRYGGKFRCGDRDPWVFNLDYKEDKRMLAGPIDDGVMRFTP